MTVQEFDSIVRERATERGMPLLSVAKSVGVNEPETYNSWLKQLKD